jgi:chlorobactene glucosyltransferase
MLKPRWNSSVLLSLLALPLGIRAERSYQRLPHLELLENAGELPALTIIIPARDEERNLQALLPTLRSAAYPGRLEILVVDDHSSDRTADTAQAHGAEVVRLEEGLPEGWKGKPHACHAGAQQARGEWLLFTDADTLHTPDGPARAMAYATANQLDGLSLFIRQECRSWSDRLALSTAFAGLFAGQRRSSPMLNGQFILLRRQVYLESGGFSAVRGEALEDVALGSWLHQQGYRVPILRGEDAAAVRMYGSHTQMFHGMSRLGSDSLRWAGSGALATALFITALVSPLIVLTGVILGKIRLRWLLPSWAAAALSILPWARRFGSPGWALLAPAGAAMVLTAAVFGLVSRIFGLGVQWKGRKV